MVISEHIGKMDEKAAELRHRRATLVARLESLQASLEEVKASLREIDEVIVILEDTKVGLQRVELSGSVSGGGAASADFSSASEPKKRASGNPKKEVVAQEVHAYLKAHGKPLSRKELFEKLSDNGFIIRGADPEMVLSTMLWRTADEFGIERLKSGGYSLKSWRSHDASFDNLLGDPSGKAPDVFD